MTAILNENSIKQCSRNLNARKGFQSMLSNHFFWQDVLAYNPGSDFFNIHRDFYPAKIAPKLSYQEVGDISSRRSPVFHAWVEYKYNVDRRWMQPYNKQGSHLLPYVSYDDDVTTYLRSVKMLHLS